MIDDGQVPADWYLNHKAGLMCDADRPGIYPSKVLIDEADSIKITPPNNLITNQSLAERAADCSKWIDRTFEQWPLKT